MKTYLIYLYAWIKHNLFLVISISLAGATSLIVRPDEQYYAYFDYKTLTCLFCFLAVICALKNISFFEIVSHKAVAYFSNTRTVVMALVFLTLIGSMLITNDMALIVFLPLSYFILDSADQKQHLAFTFIMQTLAANLGGMLTPFGNPQNLYLYSYFMIGNMEFMKIMFFPFLLSVLLIIICCLSIPKTPIVVADHYDQPLDKPRTTLYVLLFIFSVAIIFRYVPYIYGLLAITVVLWAADKKALQDVDYGLLLTFGAFFVFSGNVARMPMINSLFSTILDRSTLLTGVILSQFISNVPAAVLLSKFTTNYQELLIAVNIGGVGTMIASLASLITFREYGKHKPAGQWGFIKLFSISNFSFLALLTTFCLLFRYTV